VTAVADVIDLAVERERRNVVVITGEDCARSLRESLERQALYLAQLPETCLDDDGAA
jgi:hypothetical protein